MIKIVTVNGKDYEIDTTPRRNGYQPYHAEISGVSYREASGPIANFLRELGKEARTITLTELSEDETAQVALTLGTKFSRSKQWKNLVTWAYFNQKERKP